MESERVGLLELLMIGQGCMYLSDLPFLFKMGFLRRLIREMNAEAFSLREWTDAVKYLTDRKEHFRSQEEAKQYLLKYEPSRQSRICL